MIPADLGIDLSLLHFSLLTSHFSLLEGGQGSRRHRQLRSRAGWGAAMLAFSLSRLMLPGVSKKLSPAQ